MHAEQQLLEQKGRDMRNSQSLISFGQRDAGDGEDGGREARDTNETSGFNKQGSLLKTQN